MNCQICISNPDFSVEEIELPTEYFYEESPLWVEDGVHFCKPAPLPDSSTSLKEPSAHLLIHSSKYLSPQISLCTTPTIIHPGCLNTCVIKKQPPNLVSPILVPTAIHPHNLAVTELSSFFHSPDIYWMFPAWLPLFQWLGFSSTQN